MVALLTAVLLSQSFAHPSNCGIVYGCTSPTDPIGPNICSTWSMCDQSSVLPQMSQCSAGQYVFGLNDGGVTCSTPPGTGAGTGSCSSGQFVTATSTGAPTCATPASGAGTGSCSAGQLVSSVNSGSAPTCSAPTLTPSTSTSSRSLNSAAYQVSTTRAAFVSYSISTVCTATLLGGQQSTVQLVSDSSSSPTTVRAQVANGNSFALAISITGVNSQTAVLSGYVNAGDFVKLPTSSSGTACGTLAIVSQTETLL